MTGAWGDDGRDDLPEVEEPDVPIVWGRRYESFRSEGWVMGGHPDCWIVYTEISGWNGAGGYWIKEHWTWQSNGATHHTDIRSLSRADSQELEGRIRSIMKAREAIS